MSIKYILLLAFAFFHIGEDSGYKVKISDYKKLSKNQCFEDFYEERKVFNTHSDSKFLKNTTQKLSPLTNKEHVDTLESGLNYAIIGDDIEIYAYGDQNGNRTYNWETDTIESRLAQVYPSFKEINEGYTSIGWPSLKVIGCSDTTYEINEYLNLFTIAIPISSIDGTQEKWIELKVETMPLDAAFETSVNVIDEISLAIYEMENNKWKPVSKYTIDKDLYNFLFSDCINLIKLKNNIWILYLYTSNNMSMRHYEPETIVVIKQEDNNKYYYETIELENGDWSSTGISIKKNNNIIEY